MNARASVVVEHGAWWTGQMNIAVVLHILDFFAVEGLTLAGLVVEELAAAALTVAPLEW